MAVRVMPLSVRQEEDGRRLDVFLCGRFSRFSRAAVRRLIERGEVRAARPPSPPKASRRVRAGEVFELLFMRDDEPPWEPPKLFIRYEDDRVLALEKPPDLPVHPCGGFGEKSVLTAL